MAKFSRYASYSSCGVSGPFPCRFLGRTKIESRLPRHLRLRQTCSGSTAIAMSSKTLPAWNDRFSSGKGQNNLVR